MFKLKKDGVIKNYLVQRRTPFIIYKYCWYVKIFIKKYQKYYIVVHWYFDCFESRLIIDLLAFYQMQICLKFTQSDRLTIRFLQIFPHRTTSKWIIHFQIEVITLHKKCIIIVINFMQFLNTRCFQSLDISITSMHDIHYLKWYKTTT